MFSIWCMIMNNNNRCFSTERSENMVKNGKKIYFKNVNYYFFKTGTLFILFSPKKSLLIKKYGQRTPNLSQIEL